VDYPRAGAHYPRSTGEFLAWFGTDEDCLDYLEWLRWPGGFACPYCGNAGGWRLADGRVECGDCSRRTSVTAGTIFDKTRTPLTVWFHACWLFATAKDGISAQYLQRALEIGSYQTAWAMLHRLRSALVRPGRGRLAGTVEVDETFIGGEEHGLRGGRQPGKKVLTGIAVEIGEPKGIGRCRMAVLADASGASLGPFVAGSVEPGSRVITDGWVGYNGLAALGYAHERRNQKAAARRGQDPGELLPAVHRVASLCKRWLLGTHQGRVEPAHLQAYLNEFAFRFNRRHSRSRGMVFYRVLELAAGHDPVRYDDIRATRKPRSKPPQQRGTGHPPSLDRPAAARPWRTAEMQLQFPLRLSGYPGPRFQHAGGGETAVSVRSGGLGALGGAGFLDGEFRGGVGFQALVGDRLAAADGTAVGAVVQPVQRALDGIQPVAHALRDRVVLAFLGERQRSIGVVFRLALYLRHPVVVAGVLGLLEQPAHLVAFGDEQVAGPVLVHPAVLQVRVGRVGVHVVLGLAAHHPQHSDTAGAHEPDDQGRCRDHEHDGQPVVAPP
jgi:transposase-like protein